MTRISLGILWVGFIAYAFILAPPNQPDTFDLISRLATGDWNGINPMIIALFNLMGIWPMIYACLALIDGQAQKVPAWPFVLGSFGVGIFALLPYLSLRVAQPTWSGPKTGLIRLVDSRSLGILLAVSGIALLGFGLVAGNWSDFFEQWRTSRFIHIMSLDFLLLWLLFPLLLKDDMARRGLKQPWIFWAVALVPLAGAAVYLALRPPLPESQGESSSFAG